MTARPSRIVVVPSAPVFLPGLAQLGHDGVDAVAARCVTLIVSVLARLGQGAAVGTASAPDRPRDRDSPSGQVAAIPALSGQPPAVGDGTVGELVADHFLDLADWGERATRLGLTASTFARVDLLIVAAGGSAARGEDSPRPMADGRAFDNELLEALRNGALTRLATLDDTSAARVGCSDAAVWRALAALGDDWRSETCEDSQPLGATYVAASLTRIGN